MNYTVITYVLYLLISIGLISWVARSLFKNGSTFLIGVFNGDEKLAGSVNHLLVMGFLLLNLGYISLNMKVSADIVDLRGSIEVLSSQIGWVLLVTGGLHFFNLYACNRMRRLSRTTRQSAPGNRPLPPKPGTQQQAKAAYQQNFQAAG